GFSFKEIKSITNVSIQSRIEDKSLPDIIIKYAGYPLTAGAKKHRENKCRALEAAAVEAYRKAKENQRKRNPETLHELTEVWKDELQGLKLVLTLYKKGLAPAGIAALTRLPAYSWISQGELPFKLSRAALDLRNHKYKIPLKIDEDFAYLIGA